MIQRWCGILECLWAPDVPEVLRIACAEALCVAGTPLMSHTMKEYNTLVPIMIRY